VGYRVVPGHSRVLRFRLTARRMRTLRRRESLTLAVVATNADAAGGTPTRDAFTVRRPNQVR